MKIYTKKDFRTSEWSGGTTTEMYIYPPTAEYSKRDFLFRLSSAEVVSEKSVFTSLKGIHRILVCLSEKLCLQHDDEAPVYLKQYDQDEFDGGASTISYGMAKDLNLMLKGCSGSIEKLTINEPASLEGYSGIRLLYCAKGSISVNGLPVNEGALAEENGPIAVSGEGILFVITVDIS